MTRCSSARAFLMGAMTLLFVCQAIAANSTVKKQHKRHHRHAVTSRQVLPPRGQKFRNGSVAPYDQPDAAATDYLLRRLPEGVTTLDPHLLQEGIAEAQQLPTYSTATDSFVFPNTGSSTPINVPGGVPNASLSPSDIINPGFGSGWEHLGPGNVGGRTRALVIHPTTPNVMWAGSVGGGIWKSVDGGASWSPKADLLPDIAVTTMILDPRNPNTLYAGTGEGYFNQDAIRGAGIYKSSDGGETWSQLPSTTGSDFFFVQKLIITKSAAQRIYAATRTGVFRSTDGGTSWVKVLDSNAMGTVRGCMDLAVQTDRSIAFVFAACGTSFSTADPPAAIFRAIDTSGTQTWTKVFTATNMGRTSLSLAPSNQNIIYAMSDSSEIGNYNLGLLGVFRSTSGGASGTWTTQVANTDSNKLNTLLLSNPVEAYLKECGFSSSDVFLNQGWYDNQITVDPTNPNVVWAQGTDLFRSDDGGHNWGIASYWWFTPGADPEFSHADQHVMVFHPQYNGTTNQTMFVGSDGGIFRTDNALANTSSSPNTTTGSGAVCGNPAANDISWVSLNNQYEVTQFYDGVAYSTTGPDGASTYYFGGTQDNGTPRGDDVAGFNAWTRILGGDGGFVAVDPNNTATIFGESTGLSFKRALNGNSATPSFATRISGITEASGNFNFIAPFAMDPSNSQRLWIAGAFAWRTDNQATLWSRAGAFFADRIASIAVDPHSSDHVLMGTSVLGSIFRQAAANTSGSTTVWPSSTPRAGWVSWIAFDPTDVTGNTIYATYSTFSSGANVGHVFKSIDGGVNWANITGSIPDVPAHTVAVDPSNNQRLYVGTDIGVFVSLDGGITWNQEDTGFANVSVYAFQVANFGGVNYLYAYTHGRGAWRVQLPSALPAS